MERNLKMRKEHDFLGEKLVPDEVYYGVQTMRAKENFQITGAHLDPDFIKSMASVKKASCLTNLKTGRMERPLEKPLSRLLMKSWTAKCWTSFLWTPSRAAQVLPST